MASSGAGDLLATLFQAHPWHGVSPDAGAEGVFHAYVEMTPAEAARNARGARRCRATEIQSTSA
jgi:hypothetical protein